MKITKMEQIQTFLEHYLNNKKNYNKSSKPLVNLAGKYDRLQDPSWEVF